jgi:hypothetical protein
VDEAAMDGENAEGITAEEDTGGFIVHTAAYEEKAEEGRYGTDVGRIKIDSLANDEEIFVYAQAQFVGEVKKSEWLSNTHSAHEAGKFFNLHHQKTCSKASTVAALEAFIHPS